MNYIPIERVASQLREAPFYIREDNMDLYLIVENVFKALREMRMITLERKFETFEVKDYEVHLGPHYAIQNVVRIEEQYYPPEDGVYQPNQVLFTVAESPEISNDLSHLEEIKKVIPHIIGEYINYSKDGKCLTFKETDITVGIEYNTMALDEKGYPKVPDQAEEAVIYYVAWIHFLGEFMAGRLDGQRMQYWEELKERKMREAKLDHRMSQNQIDQLLNTLSSFDRKAFGWSA